jgi:hypothetical protein
VTTEETAAWRDAADSANIPYDKELGVHRSAGFTTLREWDFNSNAVYPLLLHEPYVRLYPAQVVKQPDLVLAMQWQSHAFNAQQKARNVDYYERRTVRDSSLSACTQAVMCAEVGHLELAHAYTKEAAMVDLRDLHTNTRDGLHMASLAGAWTALVGGFGGLRDDEHLLSLNPHLPEDFAAHLRAALAQLPVAGRRRPHRGDLPVARRAGRRAHHPARRGRSDAEHARTDDRRHQGLPAAAARAAPAAGPRTAVARPAVVSPPRLAGGADRFDRQVPQTARSVDRHHRVLRRDRRQPLVRLALPGAHVVLTLVRPAMRRARPAR